MGRMIKAFRLRQVEFEISIRHQGGSVHTIVGKYIRSLKIVKNPKLKDTYKRQELTPGQ